MLYGSLSSDREEIRVIEILDTAGDNVACKLHTVSLLDAPKFTALSYVWGDAKITKAIELDGDCVQVTVNLESALRHVGQHWRKKFTGEGEGSFRLWADAVCINQNDVEERSQQVQLMRAIYSSAVLVISWFGAHDEETELAFHNLEIIANEVRSLPEDDHIHMGWMKQYPSLCGRSDEDAGPAWTAVTDFWLHPYFNRVWIFQEIALAKAVVLAHGTSSLHLEEIEVASWWLRRCEKIIEYGVEEKPDFIFPSVWAAFTGMASPKALFLTMLKVREMLHQQKMALEVDWETSFCGGFLEATDPRDHVYGLLALTCCPIIPDYRKSLRGVYEDYVVAMMKDTNRLDWLRYAGNGMFEVDKDLPSWLPNYSQLSKVRGSTVVFGESQQADRNMLPTTEVVASFHAQKLVVSALPGPDLLRVQVPFSIDIPKTGALFTFAARYLFENKLYGTGIHPLNAVFQVLLHDQVSCPTEEAYLVKAFGFVRFLSYLAHGTDVDREEESNRDLFKLLLEYRECEPSMSPSFITDFHPNQSDSNARFIEYQVSEPVIYLEVLRLVRIVNHLKQYCSFVEAHNGYLGLAPKGARVGDTITVIQGSTALMVIRRMEDHYVLIGPCWVLGLMDGDATQLLEKGEFRTKTIELW